MSEEIESIKTVAKRDVTNRQIYETFRGILRISPTEKYVDDVSNLLCTPYITNNNRINTKKSVIDLSDSNGNKFELNLVPRIHKLKTYNKNLIKVNSKVVFMQVYTDSFLVRKNLKIRNKIHIKGPIQNNPVPPIITHYNANNLSQIVVYPSECPYDEDYFNNHNKIKFNSLANESKESGKAGYIKDIEELKNIPNSEKRYEKVKNLLKNNDNYSIYNNINSEQIVKVNGKVISYPNDKNKKIPVLYTHDKVLGFYTNHNISISSNAEEGKVAKDYIPSSIIPNNNLLKKKKTNYYDNNNNSVTVNSSNQYEIKDEAIVTKLSWIDIDKIIWDEIEDVIKGLSRHYRGRYSLFGIDRHENPFYGKDKNNNASIKVGYNSELQNTAPIVGVGVQPGSLFYHAMPLNRMLFYIAKQMKLNKKDYDNGEYPSNFSKYNWLGTSGSNYYITSHGSITPMDRESPAFFNSLTKNFITCDGKEISLDSYPNLNVLNYDLFTVNEKTCKVTGIKSEKQRSSILSEILKTPALYKFSLNKEDKNNDTIKLHTRYIRGLNWKETNNSNWTPKTNIQFAENTDYIQLSSSSETKNPYKVSLNINEVGSYAFNYETDESFKLSDHCHYIFASYDANASKCDSIIRGYNQPLIGVYDFPIVLSFTKSDCYKKYMNYCLGKTSYYSTTKNGKYYPIKTAKKYMYRIKINDDSSSRFEKTINNISIPSDSSFNDNLSLKDKKNKVYKYDQKEASIPFAVAGGSRDDLHQIYHSWLCRRWHGGRERRERSDKYRRGYGYVLHGFSTTSNDSEAKIPNACYTSLPVPEFEKLGKIDYCENIKVSSNNENKDIDFNSPGPIPPSINLIPIMAI